MNFQRKWSSSLDKWNLVCFYIWNVCVLFHLNVLAVYLPNFNFRSKYWCLFCNVFFSLSLNNSSTSSSNRRIAHVLSVHFTSFILYDYQFLITTNQIRSHLLFSLSLPLRFDDSELLGIVLPNSQIHWNKNHFV